MQLSIYSKSALKKVMSKKHIYQCLSKETVLSSLQQQTQHKSWQRFVFSKSKTRDSFCTMLWIETDNEHFGCSFAFLFSVSRVAFVRVVIDPMQLESPCHTHTEVGQGWSGQLPERAYTQRVYEVRGTGSETYQYRWIAKRVNSAIEKQQYLNSIKYYYNYWPTVTLYIDLKDCMELHSSKK